ncbi:nuclease A inhibitor family protein [Nannocystis radixulma]|uniref:Nuclease A inhibitor family protein n=1 Tax=Nannocystis radixulma TaxID=2995305 RepID=A0ABT5B5B9_9BACT|nr:nuclease A inhibitor family protein [Nannocystis radixulma]MDC0669281.1 nuclease A inhibitor family protein [Nannocystis radixulma]
MTNIATSDVHAALDRAAEQLMNAAGPDGIVSRRDIRAKLLELEGGERALVDIFYQFVDRRDAARSARITRADIDAALAVVRTDLVDRFDLDANGLSDDEVARMSELGKLAVALARTLKEATGPVGEALAREFGARAQGLMFEGYFASESSMPIEPFHAAAQVSSVTRETFRAALGLGDGPQHEIVRFEPAERCLQAFVGVFESMPELELHEPAAELVRFMKAHLRELTAIVLGRDDPALGAEHPLYIVGIDAGGGLTGIKTAVIWT